MIEEYIEIIIISLVILNIIGVPVLKNYLKKNKKQKKIKFKII